MKALLVDKNEIFREALADLLKGRAGAEVCLTCESASEALNNATKLKPDIILLDIEVDAGDCIDMTRTISQLLPSTNILILTHSEKQSDIFDCIKAGARGYVNKDCPLGSLLYAITTVGGGGVLISPPMVAKMVTEFCLLEEAMEEKHKKHKESNLFLLSRRECEVLQLVAKGVTNKDIASTLSISEHTVKTHMKNIMERLHVRNRIQAVAAAQEIMAVPMDASG